jgi:NarL family two-component system response regulator LiaR
MGTSERSWQEARILIIEDEEIVREGLSLLIDQEADLQVIGKASSTQDAIAIAREKNPDVVLLDIKLGSEDGIECLAELMLVSPDMRVLILTGTTDVETHYAAVSNGAMGIVRKIDGAEILVSAIRKVMDGEVWLNGELMAKVLDDLHRAKAARSSQTNGNGEKTNDHSGGHERAPVAAQRQPGTQKEDYEGVKIARLTDREREVIQLIGKGMRNQQIADELCISVITVRHHLTSIFSKLEVGDRFELAIYSFKHGLAIPPI